MLVAPETNVSRTSRLFTRRSAVRLSASLAGGAAVAGTDAPAAATGKLVELRLHGQGTSDGEGYDKNTASFSKQFEGKYKAVHEQNTGDNYEKQDAEFAGGTGADLYYAHTSNMRHQTYAVRGVAKQLDQYLSKDKNFNLNAWTPR